MVNGKRIPKRLVLVEDSSFVGLEVGGLSLAPLRPGLTLSDVREARLDEELMIREKIRSKGRRRDELSDLLG